jgi:hypothetical protein
VLSYLMGQKNYPIPYNIKKNCGYLLAAIIIVYVDFSIFNRNLIIGNLLFLIFILSSLYVERKELRFLIAKK